MSSIEAMLDELMHRGADDWIGVWELASIAQSSAAPATGAELLDLVLQLTEAATARGLFEIGDVVGTGIHAKYVYESCHFIPWDLVIEDAKARVRREWLALGRPPRLGEIGWLSLTERGRVHAQRLR